NLLSIKIDYFMWNNWFLPLQVSMAHNQVLGYAGYGEILAGLGIQNKFITTNPFQYFFQTLIGANVWGLILKPEIGFNFSLSDHLALNGQFGRMMALNNLLDKSGNLFKEKRINSYSVGLGLTYRFSLLENLI
ncbi:uncharacterized protein METZ01_LOCUS457269, partial [marine metagenome]